MCALLLEHYNPICFAELDCKTCEGTLKRERGCGVPPVIDLGEVDDSGDQVLLEWTPAHHIDRSERLGVDPYSVESMPEYEGAIEFFLGDLGMMWSNCARFYSEFASDAAREEAYRIILMLRAADDPILAEQYKAPMSSREVNLYRFIKLFDSKQAVHERQASQDPPESFTFEPDPNSALSTAEQLENVMRVKDYQARTRGRR